MKHCGKSTHGRALAQHWGCPFYDTDDLVVERFRPELGEHVTIRDVCLALGDDGFREAEWDALLALYRRQVRCPERYVVSLGGRLVTNSEVYPILNGLGKFVFLRVDLQLLFERVMRRGLPPFLSKERPWDDFQAVYTEREPFYTCYADLTVTLPDLPIGEASARVIRAIEEFLDVRE
ncbi:MAG: hypothetical protein HN742_04590 [Lentisphaerae bacterium]|nr:hypothetical protein [Lentisphaerota bacterium]MBT5607820.1 hypothetical protein [Lentisphaerota bacterium]MBT7057837.1 hypothetical protein [Lentisphaerota bacterium]MBT7841123.1 hypothetical protein [Lentisphaerota bacterium]